MKLVRNNTRPNAPENDDSGLKKRGRGRRIVQILAITAVPATVAFAQAELDPYNPPETEAGIPVTDPLVIEKCGGCHTADEKGNLSRISWTRTTPEFWAQVIHRMVKLNGLSITPEETKAVVRSLSTTHGLAPAEATPIAYFPERRIITETNIPNETIRQACAACHAFAQPQSWRRSASEWSLLRNLHVSLYSQADAQFRRPVEDPTQPKPAEGEEKPLPVTIALDYMKKNARLHTPEWDAWKGKATSAQLDGKWLVKADLPGKGLWFGDMVITPSGTPEEYTTTITLTSQKDGSTLTRTGKGFAYTGYSWRGMSASAGNAASAPDAPAANPTRETMMFAPDKKSATGRWFWGDYQEFGFDVTLTRASGKPVVAAILPYSLKAGSKKVKMTIFGDNLPAKLSPSQVSLGSGVAVTSVVSSTPGQAVVMVDVAPGAQIGVHDVSVAGATLAGALPVYSKVDFLKVTPDTALARLGEKGGIHGIGYQQFEALGYAYGPDGKADTKDDISLGPIDVTWAIEELPTVYYDDDVKYIGKLTPTGLFLPNIDGPNPERKWSRNNYGEVSVVATAKTEKDKAGRPLVGKSFLVVTVPAYKRWDQPEVAAQ